MATVTLEATPATRHGWYSRESAPVLTIDPGDTVRLSTLDCWWAAGPYRGGPVPEWPREEGYEEGTGHALEGPIAVRGARPGMVLEVHVDTLVPATWGTTFAGGYPSPHNVRYRLDTEEGVVLNWELDAAAGTGRDQFGHQVALRPFLGVMGMPPDRPGRHSTIPPRRTGGNLDCKDLTAGSTLYLPIEVEGALFSAGDGHAAQGDGEVGGTAIECRMELAELTIGLRDDLPLTAPAARTAEGWLTFGLGDTVDEATQEALEGMVALLGRLHGVPRAAAFALASVVVDLRITQIVNQTVGVHAVLPDGALAQS